jgi:hypothetical protein
MKSHQQRIEHTIYDEDHKTWWDDESCVYLWGEGECVVTVWPKGQFEERPETGHLDLRTFYERGKPITGDELTLERVIDMIETHEQRIKTAESLREAGDDEGADTLEDLMLDYYSEPEVWR